MRYDGLRLERVRWCCREREEAEGSPVLWNGKFRRIVNRYAVAQEARRSAPQNMPMYLYREGEREGSVAGLRFWVSWSAPLSLCVFVTAVVIATGLGLSSGEHKSGVLPVCWPRYRCLGAAT